MKCSTRILTAVVLLVSSTYAEDPWTPSPLCPFPSEEQTRFPYEGDCSKYWECYEGARYPMDCPSGLEFSADESKCESADVANCDPDATVIYPTFSHSVTTTPSSGTTQDPGPAPDCPFPSDEITFYPVANNCSQYWECFQGIRYLMSCPSGQYWNVNFNYCDYPANVDCKMDNSTTTAAPGSDTTVSSGTTATTMTVPTVTPSTVCADQPDGTFLPDPDDCHKFFECVGGEVIEGECSGDLVWNAVANTCDYPENVSCDTAKLTIK